jgi:rubrerythrin
MNALWTRLAIGVAGRIPGHSARMLLGFARAELGSMLDLRAAAERSPSIERSALYLRHALDESRHARMLFQRGAELRRARGEAPPPATSADTEDLFERLGEVAFLAFVHRGERRGRMQFEAHRDAFARRGDEKTRALFEALITDERRHEAYTWELLVELAGGVHPARAALRKAAAWEAWRLWRRAGRAGAHLAYATLMTALYLLLLPMSLLVRAVRPIRTGWVKPHDRIGEHTLPSPPALPSPAARGPHARAPRGGEPIPPAAISPHSLNEQ